jgi:hypothetical protein
MPQGVPCRGINHLGRQRRSDVNDDETRKQVEEDAAEDLELNDEDADGVGGGYLKLKIDEPQISSVDKI